MHQTLDELLDTFPFWGHCNYFKKNVFEPKYIQIHEEEEAQSEECLMTEFDHQQHDATTSLVIFQFDLSVLGF